MVQKIKGKYSLEAALVLMKLSFIHLNMKLE